MTDSSKIITKDALSKVSRHFYKEFKMNYRRFSYSVGETLLTLLKFFETAPSDTVKSFFQFNMIILCENLAMEQFKLALLVTKDYRMFITQRGMDKFTEELELVNQVNKVLFFNNFPNFQAVRVQREIMFKLKKFTELADKRITRYIEKQAEKGNQIVIKFKNAAS